MVGALPHVYFSDVPLECKLHEPSVLLCVADEHKPDIRTGRARAPQERIATRGRRNHQLRLFHGVTFAQLGGAFPYGALRARPSSVWGIASTSAGGYLAFPRIRSQIRLLAGCVAEKHAHLRHTCAMTILQATKDLRKVSLWLAQRTAEGLQPRHFRVPEAYASLPLKGQRRGKDNYLGYLQRVPDRRRLSREK